MKNELNDTQKNTKTHLRQITSYFTKKFLIRGPNRNDIINSDTTKTVLFIIIKKR